MQGRGQQIVPDRPHREAGGQAWIASRQALRRAAGRSRAGRPGCTQARSESAVLLCVVRARQRLGLRRGCANVFGSSSPGHGRRRARSTLQTPQRSSGPTVSLGRAPAAGTRAARGRRERAGSAAIRPGPSPPGSRPGRPLRRECLAQLALGAAEPVEQVGHHDRKRRLRAASRSCRGRR